MILVSSFKEALHGIFCSIQRFLCPYIRMIYPICSYSSASFITPVINAVTAFSGNSKDIPVFLKYLPVQKRYNRAPENAISIAPFKPYLYCFIF